MTKYIRLTELIPELLDNVDVKKITLTMGVDLSYLDVQVQNGCMNISRKMVS